MNRPQRSSVRRPTNYGTAWWSTVDLARHSSSSPNRTSSDSEPGRLVATSADETCEWASDSSIETHLEVDSSLSGAETCSVSCDSESISVDLERTAARKGKVRRSRKRQSQHQRGRGPNKRGRKTLPQGEGGMRPSRGDDTENRIMHTELRRSFSICVDQGVQAGSSSASALM